MQYFLKTSKLSMLRLMVKYASKRVVISVITTALLDLNK